MVPLALSLSLPWVPFIALQGTTRPTHYHVLLDEIGFSPNDLQELVHSLSYGLVHSADTEGFPFT